MSWGTKWAYSAWRGAGAGRPLRSGLAHSVQAALGPADRCRCPPSKAWSGGPARSPSSFHATSVTLLTLCWVMRVEGRRTSAESTPIPAVCSCRDVQVCFLKTAPCFCLHSLGFADCFISRILSLFQLCSYFILPVFQNYFSFLAEFFLVPLGCNVKVTEMLKRKVYCRFRCSVSSISSGVNSSVGCRSFWFCL